jgi:hypothetical protein
MLVANRRRNMLDEIKRKDIEFHKLKYCVNPEGERISVIKAKPISIIYDREEISEAEVGKIVDSNSNDISMCICDDERVVVMTTPMADRLRRISRLQTHRPSPSRNSR